MPAVAATVLGENQAIFSSGPPNENRGVNRTVEFEGRNGHAGGGDRGPVLNLASFGPDLTFLGHDFPSPSLFPGANMPSRRDLAEVLWPNRDDKRAMHRKRGMPGRLEAHEHEQSVLGRIACARPSMLACSPPTRQCPPRLPARPYGRDHSGRPPRRDGPSPDWALA